MEYWTIHTMPTDDKGMISEPGGINGGLRRRAAPEQRPLNYVLVKSADDYLAKAQALGAQITVGKMPVPGIGWFAHLVDPRATPSPSFRTTLPPPERA